MNGSTLAECKVLRGLAKKYHWLIPSVGVHPWKAQEVSVESLLPYMATFEVIGEIGMDSVWCQVPIEVQEKVFLYQLEIAKEKNKPVILHTKGQEARILELIKPYTMPILVHWYSDEKYIEKFKAKGCYFTVGPDFRTNQAVSNLVKEVDMDHLLIETDGLKAVEWAIGKEISPEYLPMHLEATLNYIAKIKKITPQEVSNHLEKNLLKFLGKV